METTYQFKKHQRGGTCGNATTLLSNRPDRTTTHDSIKTFTLLCSHTYSQNTTPHTHPHTHQPSCLTDREGALGALAGALWEPPPTDAGWDPPSTEAGWDPPSGATVPMGAHHGLHGVAPHTHGPLQGRDQRVYTAQFVGVHLLTVHIIKVIKVVH